MKKSNFTALILGVISTVFLGLGMCMVLLPEWNAFAPGVVAGVIGLVLALVTVFVWRKMENKAPIQLNGKTVLTILLGIVGAIVLGVGMCLVMVWGHIIWGILAGIVGIVLLLCLIPLARGLR